MKSMKLPDKPDSRLTRKQRMAWQEMRDLLEDVRVADRVYDSLPESKRGTIISTDIARHLDSRYAKTPPNGRLRDIEPGWDLAWRYAEDRFLREIQDRKSRKMLRLMSGGWAAGKTHALRHESSVPDLVWDGTLSRPAWAASMIEIARQNKWRIEIAYIYRNLELALYGAIERAKEAGRSVPLEQLPKSHRDSQQAVLALTEVYADREGVSFLYLHNLGKKNGATADAFEIDLKELEPNGALRYLEKHENYYRDTAEHLAQGSDD